MTSKITYVIGHKNPDTDSICSAIALAELKSAEGAENVVAARAGDINPQTSFILDYFNVQPPKYLPDVYPKARDIMSVDVVSVAEKTPVQKVMEIMREEKIRFIPVLDPEGRPRGALTLMDLARRYIVRFDTEGSREVTTSLENIIDTLTGEVIVDSLGDATRTFSVFVGAMEVDSFLRILGDRDPAECVVIVGDRVDVQTSSVELGVGLLIVSGGFPVNEAIVREAKERGTSVVISPFDSATTALLVRLSTPAHLICDAAVESAAPGDLVDGLRHRIAGVNGLVVLGEDGVMQGVITKSCLLRPSTTDLVLVDHNELSQAVDGADKVNIVEVIDHHRIGNFNTSQAIPFTCDPVGSTSCLVAELYRRKNVEIRPEIAGILLAGVLSDTVMLKSPTTTDRDRDIIVWLEAAAGLDHKKFGSEIFAATSSLKKRGAGAVVKGDHKVFEAKGMKFGIGQVETIGFDEFYDEKAALMKELEKVRVEKELKLSSILITDIVYGTSLLLAVGDSEVLYNLGYPKLEENVFELKNVISRKKQVVPHMLGVFNEIY